MRRICLITLLLVVLSTACLADVVVVAPANNTTVSSPIHFVAQASSVNGIASMTINVDSQDAYRINSSSLDTYVTLTPGTRRVLVKAWDNKGNYMDAPLTLNVTSPSGNAVTVTAPGDGTTVASPVRFVASATSPNGVASMTVNVDSQDRFKINSDHLDTTLALSAGSHIVFIKAWDNKGNYFDRRLAINVSGTVGTGPTISVNAPASNTSVGSPVRFVATAASPNGIHSMTINVDSQDVYQTWSDRLDSQVPLGPGPHSVLIKAWDNRGNYSHVPLTLTVSKYNSPGVGTQLTGTWNMMQAESGWGSCTECAGNVTGTGTPAGYAMTQHQGNPSLTGDSTKFDIWGQYPYSNVLWNQHLIGDGSGRLDVNNIVPQVHHFKYDVWFYFTNAHAMEAIEFDINQFFGGKSFIWGHECRVLGGNMWDVWNNTLQRWESTGFPCYPNTNAWNHVVIEVERTWDDQLHYVYIEMNGQRHWMHRYEPPTPTNWYGITINFQLDGNYRQEPYSAWLDKLSFSYW